MDDRTTAKLLVNVAVLEFLMHSLYVHEFKKVANPAMEAGNLANEDLCSFVRVMSAWCRGSYLEA